MIEDLIVFIKVFLCIEWAIVSFMALRKLWLYVREQNEGGNKIFDFPSLNNSNLEKFGLFEIIFYFVLSFFPFLNLLLFFTILFREKEFRKK
jgi:hypothetical protein